MRYRRAQTAGASYFFTVNLANRQSDLLVREIAALRGIIRIVKRAHPFDIEAMVVLPEHLHAIWKLPEGDADYPMHWSLIKSGFSRGLEKTEFIRASRVSKCPNSVRSCIVYMSLGARRGGYTSSIQDLLSIINACSMTC